MGKKKSKSNNGGSETSNNNNSNSNNNGGSETSNNDSKNGGEGDYFNIVYKVDFHCDGCAQRIRKNILSFPGVKIVDLEGESKVKVVAMKTVNAVKLKETIEKKMVKKVELISPQPPKNDDQKKDNKSSSNDKPKELPMVTLTLKIPYHCHGCGEKTYKALSSYKGVYEVKIDKEKDLATVKGKVDGKKLVEDIKKKLKKTVEIVPEKKPQQEKKDGGEKDAEKKDDKSGGGSGGKGGEKAFIIDYYSAGAVHGDGYRYGYEYGYGYMPVGVFETHVFSDENPNACSIM